MFDKIIEVYRPDVNYFLKIKLSLTQFYDLKKHSYTMFCTPLYEEKCTKLSTLCKYRMCKAQYILNCDKCGSNFISNGRTLNQNYSEVCPICNIPHIKLVH